MMVLIRVPFSFGAALAATPAPMPIPNGESFVPLLWIKDKDMNWKEFEMQVAKDMFIAINTGFGTSCTEEKYAYVRAKEAITYARAFVKEMKKAYEEGN